MAEYLKKAFHSVARHFAYPRSVFDMSPVDLGHFAQRSDADALRADWARIGLDLQRAAERVYCNG